MLLSQSLAYTQWLPEPACLNWQNTHFTRVHFERILGSRLLGVFAGWFTGPAIEERADQPAMTEPRPPQRQAGDKPG
jgi:hypothetical protein